MNKQKVLSDPSSCLNKAAPDEPLFVLRAKDPHAPMTIRHWCAMSVGEQPPEKITAALTVASDMESWANPSVAEARPA